MIKSIFGLIPARGGSKRLPGKNLKLLAGVSLLARAIAHAKVLPVTVVSTDDPETMALANRLGVHALLRPAYLASDNATTEDVIEHAANVYPMFEWFCLLQPTSPLRTAGDIRACIDLALSTERPVVSVCNGRRNGAVYVGRTLALPNEYWLDAITYEMPPGRSIDIDTLADFNEAERVLNASEIRTSSTGQVLS